MAFSCPSLFIFACTTAPAVQAAEPERLAPTPANSAVSDVTTITATQLADEPYDQPYAFYQHDRTALDHNVGRIVLDRINYGPGVFMQSTAPAQFSPSFAA